MIHRSVESAIEKASLKYENMSVSGHVTIKQIFNQQKNLFSASQTFSALIKICQHFFICDNFKNIIDTLKKYS